MAPREGAAPVAEEPALVAEEPALVVEEPALVAGETAHCTEVASSEDAAPVKLDLPIGTVRKEKKDKKKKKR